MRPADRSLRYESLCPHGVGRHDLAKGENKTVMTVMGYGYTSDQIVDLSTADLEQYFER